MKALWTIYNRKKEKIYNKLARVSNATREEPKIVLMVQNRKKSFLHGRIRET